MGPAPHEAKVSQGWHLTALTVYLNKKVSALPAGDGMAEAMFSSLLTK